MLLAGELAGDAGGAVRSGPAAVPVRVAGQVQVQEQEPPWRAPLAPFTVRGRWADPHALSYRLDPAGGPFDAATFAAAIEAAQQSWSRTGLVGFRPAAADETRPDVVFAWHGGESTSCTPFGYDYSVAHSGPFGPGGFVHFDSSHGWSLDGSSGESLAEAAAHEIGHILGLDHGDDPGSLMWPDTQVTEPAASDLAGLHSLYGGGTDAPGDLAVVRRAEPSAAPARLLTLRGVAPPALTAHALFDTDGDGDDELLVWRTDALAQGSVMIYHFAPAPTAAAGAAPEVAPGAAAAPASRSGAGSRSGSGPSAGSGPVPAPVLVRSVGPLAGVFPAGGQHFLSVGPQGQRWIVTRASDGSAGAFGFDAAGLPRELSTQEASEALGAADQVLRLAGDLDGDGLPEAVEPVD